MHDRLGQAGGAAGIDDPQRMVERQPQRLEGATAASSRAHGLRQVGARRAAPAQLAAPQVRGTIRVRDAGQSRAQFARPRRCGRSRGRRSVTPSQAISTLGSICLKRSSTAFVPMSGAHRLQTPPMLATARKATWPRDVGQVGRHAVAGLHALRLQVQGQRSRPGAAARASVSSRCRPCLVAADRSPANPAACAGVHMAEHLLRVVELRALEPARAGHARVGQHARDAAWGTAARNSPRCFARTPAGRVVDQRHSAS